MTRTDPYPNHQDPMKETKIATGGDSSNSSGMIVAGGGALAGDVHQVDRKKRGMEGGGALEIRQRQPTS